MIQLQIKYNLNLFSLMLYLLLPLFGITWTYVETILQNRLCYIKNCSLPVRRKFLIVCYCNLAAFGLLIHGNTYVYQRFSRCQSSILKFCILNASSTIPVYVFMNIVISFLVHTYILHVFIRSIDVTRSIWLLP